MMGDAGCPAVAIGFAVAQCGIEPVFGGGNNVGDIDVVGTASENVASTRPAHAFHQSRTAQLAKQLFQIRKGNVLPLADGIELYCSGLGVHGQIYHGSYGKTSFGSQSHGFGKVPV